MSTININHLKLPGSYLFSEIAGRVKNYKEMHPEASVISLGIGDVTRPLVPSVVKALHNAVEEMGSGESFRGYGPEQGYHFLRETICKNDFAQRNVDITPQEVFISDGAKSDLGNFLDLFNASARIAVTDPVYPVYVDTNVMGGRAGQLQENGAWSNLIYLSGSAETGFVPQLPQQRPDVIYLCCPNNPTGTTLTYAQLTEWVNYARDNDTVILYDAAYESFIEEENVPHSIYEIPGAKEVAVEFRSFSKTAGFTGLRCGYTVVPTALKKRNGTVSLNALWNRRQSTKFNGTPYIVQRAAEAIYSADGKRECMEQIAYYKENARIIRKALNACGFETFGGVNAPYIWLRIPEGFTSWSFFDALLNECQVVGTPGVGFGIAGEGYLRLTAFGNREQTIEALKRIAAWKR
ncbi:MAG: LL-diaminopimelate aminotransferase [Marinifilaceae bacterium]